MGSVKDWTGNSRSAHSMLGARNYALNEREANDYYATKPKAAWLLMEVESFSPYIWECACDEGHLAKEFIKACPFCGAPAQLREISGHWGVECTKHCAGTLIFNDKDKAIEAWNRRANDGEIR